MSNIRITNYASNIRPSPGEREVYTGHSRWIGNSPLANHFSVKKYGRGEAIEKYRQWLREALQDAHSAQSVEL